MCGFSKRLSEIANSSKFHHSAEADAIFINHRFQQMVNEVAEFKKQIHVTCQEDLEIKVGRTGSNSGLWINRPLVCLIQEGPILAAVPISHFTRD